MSAGEMFGRLLALSLGHPLLGRLFVASLEMVVVSAVVLVIVRAARLKSNRVISLLWLVALAKPVVSLLIGAPAPVWNAGSLGVLPLPATPTVAETASARPGEGAFSRHVEYGPAASAASGVPASGAATGSFLDPARSLVVAWLAGVALMVVLSAADRRRIRRLVRGASAPPAEIAALYREAAADRGASPPPRLLVSDRLESPALAGTISPVVLLPAWLIDAPDRERLLWSLRHELTHWRHRDHLAAFAGELSRILFFFHPLVWWVGHTWKVTAEIACDQAMVATGRDARRYAEQLYQILSRVHERRRIMMAPGLFATRTQIGRRIELLLKSHPRGRARHRLPAVAFLLVFGALVFSLGAELSPQAEPGDVIVKATSKKDGSVVATIHEDDGNARNVVMKIEGEVKFNDDGTDVVGVSPGGSFTIDEVLDGVERSLKIESSEGGELVYDYEVDGETRPFDDEAREWFAQLMESVEVHGGRDVRLVSRPGAAFHHSIVVGDAENSKVTLSIIDRDHETDLDDDTAAINVFMDRGEGDDRVRIRTSTGVVGRDGDRVVFNVTSSGRVGITVWKDGDEHDLEVKVGHGGDMEFIYKLNGESRPYDENARKIFDRYIRLLKDGLELNVKGERI
jgi:beta-lactamase regulating signal transducer with metallopeptidase domain